ncbi:chemotaxis protein CheW [Shewanella sp. Isolate11]|uniref:chemotaxis protein CheW n=1 Tax=Shewanella sp. Isolate11 TaxID=2908530 RepID=UPI001EFE3C4B|nr:chemotaxis protein CheW [Shewanella sp. Isolate11]MCG9697128.1 chemotaxis protein CheW [Shewanella sp. Isolate11]
MPNSVDDAIYDYFAELLNDASDEAHQVQQQLSSPAEVVVQSKPFMEAGEEQGEVRNSELKRSQPRLDKRALEQLLAPLAKVEQSEAEDSVIKQIAQPIADTEQTLNADQVLDAVNEIKMVELDSQPFAFAADAIDRDSGDKSLTRITDAVEPALQVEPAPLAVTRDLVDELEDEFQVLFFKVAGLTLAVPLVSLGGIVQVGRVNHIMGRPAWFHGVQTHRDAQLNIVDTCAWVMPEKYDDNLKQSIDYQYIVMLEGSNWGLACESLVNTVKIVKSEVNWRAKAGKRPWLAGMVKQQMCGIIHVQALIELLNLGLGCQDSIE